jgi:hypothetical protein
MKKLNGGIIAAVVGLLFAIGVQEASSKSVNPEYGQLSNGTWILVTPQTEADYACESSSSVCKARFPQDPNQSTSGMQITANNGVYELQ